MISNVLLLFALEEYLGPQMIFLRDFLVGR